MLVDSVFEGNIKDPDTIFAELAELLHTETGKKVIVLIDEYDTPITSSYDNNYMQKVLRTPLLWVDTIY